MSSDKIGLSVVWWSMDNFDAISIIVSIHL